MPPCLATDVPRRLRPELAGPWRLLAPAPDLSPFGLEPPDSPGQGPGLGLNEPNDHTIFQTPDGTWHLWACVRRTRVGRILVHWQTPDFQASPWTLSGAILRADRSAGESLVDWRDEEFIQSPFVLTRDGRFWMVYGGYDSGRDAAGQLTDDYDRVEKQICLMTSEDGRSWTRRRDAEGRSRLFAGPGAARDPCVLEWQGQYYLYYSGHHDQNRTRAGIYARTSPDLLTWSDWRLVHWDPRPLDDGRPCIHESPFVVRRDGFFYLFRNPGRYGGTHVFRSSDPLDFGVGAERIDALYVTHLPEVIAPEIVAGPDGREYLSRINSPHGYAIQVAPLRWVEDPAGDLPP